MTEEQRTNYFEVREIERYQPDVISACRMTLGALVEESQKDFSQQDHILIQSLFDLYHSAEKEAEEKIRDELAYITVIAAEKLGLIVDMAPNEQDGVLKSQYARERDTDDFGLIVEAHKGEERKHIQNATLMTITEAQRLSEEFAEEDTYTTSYETFNDQLENSDIEKLGLASPVTMNQAKEIVANYKARNIPTSVTFIVNIGEIAMVIDMSKWDKDDPVFRGYSNLGIRSSISMRDVMWNALREGMPITYQGQQLKAEEKHALEINYEDARDKIIEILSRGTDQLSSRARKMLQLTEMSPDEISDRETEQQKYLAQTFSKPDSQGRQPNAIITRSGTSANELAYKAIIEQAFTQGTQIKLYTEDGLWYYENNPNFDENNPHIRSTSTLEEANMAILTVQPNIPAENYDDLKSKPLSMIKKWSIKLS